MSWWLAVDSGLGKGLEDEVSSVCFLWFSGPRIWGIEFTIDVPLPRFFFMGEVFSVLAWSPVTLLLSWTLPTPWLHSFLRCSLGKMV